MKRAMPMYTRIWAPTLLVVCLAGCTTTLVNEHLVTGAQPKQPGFSYFLPRQRFTVNATYELRSCPDAAGDADEAARPLVLTQSVTVAEVPVADPAELYSIPLKTLTSGWKTTTLTGSVYDNQTLHTFGATVEDRTGAILKAALGTAVSLARIATGTPAAAGAPSLCRPEIYKALGTLREAKAKLFDPTLDEKTRASWIAAIAAAKASLQITETYVFDPVPARLEFTGSPKPEKLLGWFANPQLIAFAKDNDHYTRTLTTGMLVKIAPTTIVALPTELKDQGVVYREPAPVLLQVCAGSCSLDPPEVLATLESQAPQFGRYAVIPLENGPFQKNNLSLSFAPNGRLETFTYGEESQLEKLATSGSESALSIEGYVAKKKAADEASATAAAGEELKTLKAETELLKAKADKIEAEARLSTLTGGQ